MSDEESTMPAEFPTSIAFKDLEATHPEYNPVDPLTRIGVLDKHEDLYRGGRGFRQHIEHYLVKRQIEGGGNASVGSQMIAAADAALNPKSSGSPLESTTAHLQGAGKGSAGQRQWDARKKRAWYTSFVSCIIDFIVAAVNQNQPSVVRVPEDADTVLTDDPKMEYWRRLNENADGSGTDLAALARNALQEVLIHKRAYLAIRFPDVAATNLGEQEEQGGLDATICLWGARFVDDWECDANGNLIWIRTHSVKKVRETPYGQPDHELHCWTYITKSAFYEYEITYKDRPEAEQMIERKSVRVHELKDADGNPRLPVVPIRLNEGLWVMDRLADTVLALFNRQSAATWTLDQMAFALLVVRSNKPIDSIPADDIAGLLLDPNDDAGFKSPDPSIHSAQQSDIERLKAELFSAIHMMSLQAMKDKGGNPASGDAKEMDMGGMSTLLSAFASPERDALEAVVEIIKVARDEQDLILAVQGLDKFDVQSIEKKLKNAKEFLALGDVPPSARDWTMLDASLAMTANAPAKVRERVVDEVMQKSKEKPEAEEVEEPEESNDEEMLKESAKS